MRKTIQTLCVLLAVTSTTIIGTAGSAAADIGQGQRNGADRTGSPAIPADERGYDRASWNVYGDKNYQHGVDDAEALRTEAVFGFIEDTAPYNFQNGYDMPSYAERYQNHRTRCDYSQAYSFALTDPDYGLLLETDSPLGTVAAFKDELRSELEEGNGDDFYLSIVRGMLEYLEEEKQGDFPEDRRINSLCAGFGMWKAYCPAGTTRENQSIPLYQAYPMTTREEFCTPSTKVTGWEYAYGSEIGEEVEVDASGNITDVYGWETTVERTGPDPDPTDPFEKQTTFVLSPFGEMYQGYVERCSGILDDRNTENPRCAYGDSWTFDSQLANSMAETARVPHASVQVTEENRRAAAKGGVVTVTEREFYATVMRERYVDKGYQRWCVTSTSYDQAGNAEATTKDCEQWIHNPERDRTTWEIAAAANTPRIVRKYQTLVVHCNQGGYDAVTTDDQHQEYRDKERHQPFTNTAITRDLGPDEQLVWGSSESRHPATADPSFYDKNCSSRGVRSNFWPENEPNYGVTGNAPGINFRSGEWIDFKPDFYEPEGWNGIVPFNGEDPSSVTVNLWNPRNANSNILMQVEAEDCNGQTKTLFGGDEAKPASLYTDPENNAVWSGTVEGCFKNDLRVKGIWANDPGQPFVLGVYWTWDLQVNTLAPDLAGWASPAGQRYYRLAQSNVPIKISVASYHTDSAVAHVQAFDEHFESHTGTSATSPVNVFDIHGVNTWDDAGRLRWSEDPATYSPFYYSWRFVRAVGM